MQISFISLTTEKITLFDLRPECNMNFYSCQYGHYTKVVAFMYVGG